jgi:hypothetical protein
VLTQCARDASEFGRSHECTLKNRGASSIRQSCSPHPSPLPWGEGELHSVLFENRPGGFARGTPEFNASCQAA